MLRKLFVITLLIALGSVHCEPQSQKPSSSDTSGRFFDLSTLLYGNRYRPQYPYGGGSYPGGYGGGYGGYGGGGYGNGGYGGYGTNFIGNGGYGGQSGNGGLSSYYGYNNGNDNTRYRGGGNLGYGYYDPNLFADRNVRPQYVPSGYRGYN